MDNTKKIKKKIDKTLADLYENGFVVTAENYAADGVYDSTGFTLLRLSPYHDVDDDGNIDYTRSLGDINKEMAEKYITDDGTMWHLGIERITASGFSFEWGMVYPDNDIHRKFQEMGALSQLIHLGSLAPKGHHLGDEKIERTLYKLIKQISEYDDAVYDETHEVDDEQI